MKRIFAALAAITFLLAISSPAQFPKPGGGGGGSSLTAGTDYAKPALHDTFANVAAAPCGSTENGRMARTTNSVYEAHCDGSVLSWFLSGLSVTPPPSTGWSTDNLDSSEINSSNGYQYISTPQSGATRITVRHRTAPATPYTVKFILRTDRSGLPPGTGPTYINVGVGVAFRASDGKIIDFRTGNDSGTYNALTQKWNSSTSGGAAYTFITTANSHVDYYTRPDKHFALTDDGTNLKFWWSLTGKSGEWKLFDSRARTDFMASGPNDYGYLTYANGGAVELAVLSVVETASATP